MKIFSLKDMESKTCELFVSLKGVVKCLQSKNPIDNKFYLVRGILGQDKEYHELTEDEIVKCREEWRAQNGDNYALALFLDEDWGFLKFKTQYVIGTLNVIEDDENYDRAKL